METETQKRNPSLFIEQGDSTVHQFYTLWRDSQRIMWQSAALHKLFIAPQCLCTIVKALFLPLQSMLGFSS